MISAHIQQTLIDAGRITVNGYGRNAQLHPCRRCRQWVVAGPDHHRCALHVVCDPVALDTLGECAAILAGRATYELWGRELERRDQFRIRGGMHRPVIAAHECGIAKVADQSIIRLFTGNRQPTEMGTPCPF